MGNNVIEFTLKTDDKATKKFKAFANTMKNTAINVAKFATVAAAGITATVAFTKVIANAQDKAGKFAFKIGKSVENLTKYQFAADLSGIKTETFNMAIQRMERRLGEAAQGTGEALSTLRDLGIEAKTFADLPLDTQLETLADRFSNMESGTLALKTAFKLFDSEGVAMLQLLKKGTPAMREMADEAGRLGLIVSSQTAANSEAFNDSLTRLTGSLAGVSRGIGNELMPMMTGLADSLTDLVVNNRGNIETFFKNIFTGFFTFGFIAKDIFTKVKAGLTAAFSGDIFENFTSAAGQAIAWIQDNALQFIAGYGRVLITGFKIIWEGFVTAGKWAWNSIKSIFGGEKTISFGDLLFKKLAEETGKARENFKVEMGNFKVIALDTSTAVGDAIGKVVDVNVAAAGKQASELIKTFEVFGTVADNTKAKDLESTKTYLESLEGLYTEYMATQKTATEQLATLSSQLFISTTQGIGDAVGQAVVMQKNLLDSLAAIGQQVLSSIISMLVQVGIQRIALAGIQSGATVKQSSQDIAAAAGKTYANAYASTVGIPGVGIFAANAVASAAAANMLAGAAVSGAAGGAVGAAIPIAHGGLDYVPSEQTYLLNGGERVLSPNQNKDFTNAIDGGGLSGGRGGVVIENITILPNATSAQALLDMPPEEMRRVVEDKIIDALNELDGIGIRQNALDKVV